jgi:hypothetical protein
MEPKEQGGDRSTGGDDRRAEIGPGGGPPDDRERQRRGATPTEDVMDEALREGAPEPRPPGTGEQGELREPDVGAGERPEHAD